MKVGYSTYNHPNVGATLIIVSVIVIIGCINFFCAVGFNHFSVIHDSKAGNVSTSCSTLECCGNIQDVVLKREVMGGIGSMEELCGAISMTTGIKLVTGA